MAIRELRSRGSLSLSGGGRATLRSVHGHNGKTRAAVRGARPLGNRRRAPGCGPTRSCIRAGSVTNSLIFWARASASPGGTMSSGGRSSGMPPTVEPRQGRARAMASIIARGSPSCRDGSRKRSARSSSSRMGSPDASCPRKWTLAAMPSRAARSANAGRCWPSPTRISSTSRPCCRQRATASICTSCAL